jgi:hypothetical protein
VDAGVLMSYQKPKTNFCNKYKSGPQEMHGSAFKVDVYQFDKTFANQLHEIEFRVFDVVSNIYIYIYVYGFLLKLIFMATSKNIIFLLR